MDGNLTCLGSVGVIFVLLALFMASRALKDSRAYRDSENWIPTVAQITASNVTVQRGTKGGTSYGTYILYKYQVLGQDYQGNQLSFGSEGTSYGTRKKAEEVVARYPMERQAPIYYDPNNHSQAVLERKYSATGAILSVIFGLAGAVMAIYAFLQSSGFGK